MKIITYFVFTLLSIFIQFCVMDFIQEKMQIEQKQSDFGKTSQRVNFSNIIKNISSLKPEALYYNIKSSQFTWNSAVNPVNGLDLTNASVEVTTIDSLNSVFDFYDENSSMTEFTSTTDMVATSTEVDNFTDITLYNTNIQSTTGNFSATSFNKHCNCNFMYKLCDVYCCCDYDCKEHERKLFSCSNNKKEILTNQDKSCNHFLPQGKVLNSLFCIVKTNLPNKRIIKQEKTNLRHFYKWKENVTTVITRESKDYNNNINETKEFIWILNKESISYLDIPRQFINNYCTDRQPVKIFDSIKSICVVKFNDLEMFHILNIFENGIVVNPKDNVLNDTALNCSTLFCASCNIIACNNNVCATYNKSIHEPTCTDKLCINVALKIDYIFYYNNFKITNVTLKFHMDNISMAIPFFTQEINVDFIMGNISMDDILEFSGSPGYVFGRPIIISQEVGNHTENFFKGAHSEIYLRRPDNKKGLCVLNNNTDNFILFGINKRNKCRFVYIKTIENVTAVCKDIHESIKTILSLNKKIVVSPYGNPYEVKDNEWVEIKKRNDDFEARDMDSKTSKLYCYNIPTKLSFVFAYEDLGNELGYKILQAEYEMKVKNKFFDPEDISSVITIDVSFVDLTTPDIEEYASGPYINIGLPKDFFYPFLSNNSNINYIAVLHITYWILIVFK